MKYVIFEKDTMTEDFFDTKEDAEKHLSECNDEYIEKYRVTIREVDDFAKKVFDFLYDDYAPFFDKQEELFNIFLEDKDLFNKVYELYFSDNNDKEDKFYDSEYFRLEIDTRIEQSILSKKFNESTLLEIQQDILKRFRRCNKFIKRNSKYFNSDYKLKGVIKSIGNTRNDYEWQISLVAYDGENEFDLNRFSLSDEEFRYLIKHYTIDLRVATKVVCVPEEDWLI